MSQPRAPYANRGPVQYTSISSAVEFDPPIPWIHVESAGSGGLVVKSEDGTARTYTSLPAGRTLYGPFTEITSMTLARILVGDGKAPEDTLGTAAPAATGSLGAVKMSVAPADGANPIAVGDNDPRLPGYWKTAATQTASWTLDIDTLYIINTTNTAATATLPAISSSNDGHRVGMFNAGTTAAVWTPASGDTVGGTAASNATLAGPAAGTMKTLVANLAVRRWIPLA
jgi:hypothetical protein